MADTTLLAFSDMDVPPYSARGISQTLTPIAGSVQLKRTVNGELVDISPPAFRKYASSINCTDQQSPAIDGRWPGMEVTVDCVVELGYLTSGGSPGRPVVSGSSRVDGAFTFYRPQITFLIAGFNLSKDEYGATVGWSLDLEEV